MAKFFTQFSEHELRELISYAVREQLQNLFHRKEKEKHEEELLSIKQVCEIFKVSRQTVLDWRKKGLIQSISLNRRVFFLKNKLFDNLKQRNRILGEEI